MKSLWSDSEASHYRTPLGLRVYSSRLLGRDKGLVLHGGGNTSVKLAQRSVMGEDEEVLFVKGSGWDLETIDEPGFAPVRLEPLVRLSRLKRLSDTEMMNALNTQRLRASAPSPSVEAILHAILPFRYVDHTHADAVLAITNTHDGAARVAEIFGDDTVLVPYVMPGFDLARLCAREFPRQRHAGTSGMILMNHGVFSFADSARESYERMIVLVDRAERYLKRHKAWSLPPARAKPPRRSLRADIARLRCELSDRAGQPLIVCTSQAAPALEFCGRPDVTELAGQGPATPDHSIRTKRVPLVGRDVAGYARAYRRYFESHERKAAEPKSMLDPAPRIVLDPELGLCAAGRSGKDAAIALEIYQHTIEVILRATALHGYKALSAREVFEVEYWDLEQAKLKLAGKPPELAGEVALVTGAASGIGRACVDALLARGAAVVALDRNETVATILQRPDFLGLTCDVTSKDAVEAALESAVRRFGGIDIAVLNAGIFPLGTPVADASLDAWREAMAVNVEANVTLLRACHPLLQLASRGGRVVAIGSKNVAAPGIGAAAYSASKAALTQLARVCALEWGRDGIRVNTVHPDAVFDTALWSDDVLEARARHYGLTVEQYKTRNVLRTEIKSRDVAELVCALCGAAFARTTGAQIPIDGGNERII
ncbi:MAG: bifunctional aldolase/short-chain dehydrogenase [Betaproteobacteria bacterium]|nr:bifunctional aldolase/short-chain dehydrogenase [Betaproteobacteria bacterium]